MNTPVLSFNGGELTPLLRHRTDFAKNPSAAARMENFIPLAHGPVTRRPGTQYVATLPATPLNTQLFPFTTSDGARYLIHITPGALRVIGAADGVTKASFQYLLGSPPPDARQCQLHQLNDVAFITHPRAHPAILRTTGDTAWTFDFHIPTAPPTLPQNLDKEKFLSLLSNPIAPGWIVGTSYTTASVVMVEGAEWQAIRNHTAASSDRPVTGANWKTYWRRKIYLASDPVTLVSYGIEAPDHRFEPTTYQAGTIRLFDNANYGGLTVNPIDQPNPQHRICILTHSAMGTGEDPTNAFTTYWQYLYPSWTSISLFTDIIVGTTILIGLRIFRCIEEHSPNEPVNHPITGTDAAIYWVELEETTTEELATPWDYPRYLTGQRVNISGVVYQCKLSHFVSDPTRPGTGASWETYWDIVANPAALFNTLHAAEAFLSPGTSWEISPEREAADYQLELPASTSVANVPSPAIAIQGGWSFGTFGQAWHGAFEIQRSLNNGATYETIRTYESSGDRNISASGTEPEPALLRMVFRAVTLSSSNTAGRAVLTPESRSVTGHALATTYVSANTMRGTALSPMMSGKTIRWSEGAFSRLRGFPQSLAFHDARLIYAGTTFRPTTLWFSATDSVENFRPGTDPADPLQITLATSVENRIRWMASQRKLFIGTATSEWVVGAQDFDVPITPGDVIARRHTSFGSAHRQPAPLADSFVFLSRSRQRLREIAFVDERSAYSAPELTRLSDHLTAAGVRSMAWQQNREPALWATTDDGLLLHFSFNREDQITAWSRHTSPVALFHSVITFPGDGGDDLTLLIANRTFGSTTTATLERLPPDWSNQTLHPSASPLAPFDLAITAAGPGPVTTPSFLNGHPLRALINGHTLTTLTPSAGTVTLPAGTATVTLGLPYTSILETLPLDIGTGAPDATHSRRKRLHALSLNLRHTTAGSIAYAGSHPDPLPLDPCPFTGWLDVALPPGHADDCTFTLCTSGPHPFTLVAAALRWAQTERQS